MVTEREVRETSEDIAAIRSYLQSLDPEMPIKVNHSCACVYHGYLFHRFPNVRRIQILYDQLRIQENTSESDLTVSIDGSFAEYIQRRWTMRAREECEDEDLDENDRTLTAAQCIEELNVLADCWAD